MSRIPFDAAHRELRSSGSLPAGEERLVHALCNASSVRWAYLFGSAARGESYRDLDVAVMLQDEARGAVALGRVAERIEAAARPCPVDVVDLASAPPRLAGTIAREGRVLMDRDPPGRRRWQLEANRRGLDIEPWLERFEQLRLRAITERENDGRVR